MGNNLDLVSLLGLPKDVECPQCKREIKSGFDDYDIECGSPEAKNHNGLLTLHVYCSECGNEFEAKVRCSVLQKITVVDKSEFTKASWTEGGVQLEGKILESHEEFVETDADNMPVMGAIDREIYPLVKALNEAGLRTTQSCSGHKEGDLAEISIDMETVEDVAVRQNGRRLVIWWKMRKDGKKFSVPIAERGEDRGTIGEMISIRKVAEETPFNPEKDKKWEEPKRAINNDCDK